MWIKRPEYPPMEANGFKCLSHCGIWCPALSRYPVACIFRDIETHAHMALGGEMIDLVRLDMVEQLDQVRRIGNVPVVQKEPHVIDVEVLREVVDTPGVERGGTVNNAMHLIVFGEE
jgi:hypothetical protein